MPKHEQYLGVAQAFANFSKDPSTKVGCIIVGAEDGEVRAQGYNGFPRRSSADNNIAGMERQTKLDLTIHAEANAIANTARVGGASLKNCIAYITHPPCHECAKLLVQTGISEVHYQDPGDEMRKRWLGSFALANDMLEEAGIKVIAHKIADFE